MTWDGWGFNLETGEVSIGYGGIGDFANNYYNTVDQSEHRESYRKIADDFANYYGEVDIFTMVMDGKWLSQQSRQTEEERDYSWVRLRYFDQAARELTGLGGNPAKPIVIQKYTVKSARDDGTRDDPINAATLTAVRDNTGKAISADDPRFNQNAVFDGTTPTRFKTLAGIQVSFDVGNSRVPGWGIEDIDFANSSVSIYKAGQSDPVYTEPLKADSWVRCSCSRAILNMRQVYIT